MRRSVQARSVNSAPGQTCRFPLGSALSRLLAALRRRLRGGGANDDAVSSSGCPSPPGVEAKARERKPEIGADYSPPFSAAQRARSARKVSSSGTSFLQADVPVVVPCFNNPTYTARMVSQLRRLGFRRIVLTDGGSTYPPMRDLLNAPGEAVSVVLLSENPGPRHVFLDPVTFAALPRHFCVTDPDLAFNPAMPVDFLDDLAALSARERVGKAGLALDLSDREAMRDEPIQIGERTWQIWEWEEQFWRDELPPLRRGGDPVYRAPVDTTFALYDKTFFDPDHFLEAVRVAGRFTCRHLPWYRARELSEEEERFYRSTQSGSYYLGGENPSPPGRPSR